MASRLDPMPVGTPLLMRWDNPNGIFYSVGRVMQVDPYANGERVRIIIGAVGSDIEDKQLWQSRSGVPAIALTETELVGLRVVAASVRDWPEYIDRYWHAKQPPGGA